MNNVESRRARAFKKRLECVGVALFGWTRDPVRGTELLCNVDGKRNVLAFDCPDRMHKNQLFDAKAETVAFAFAITELSMNVESVEDGRSGESPVKELLSGEFVDSDMTPLATGNGFSGRQFDDAGVPVALPCRVVVMPNSWLAFAGPRYCDRSRKVHGDGAKVLDNDEVAIDESGRDEFAKLGDVGFGCCFRAMESRRPIGPSTDCEVGEENVRISLTGHGSHLESGTMQRVDPGIGHDGHSISTAETERKHSARGH